MVGLRYFAGGVVFVLFRRLACELPVGIPAGRRFFLGAAVALLLAFARVYPLPRYMSSSGRWLVTWWDKI